MTVYEINFYDELSPRDWKSTLGIAKNNELRFVRYFSSRQALKGFFHFSTETCWPIQVTLILCSPTLSPIRFCRARVSSRSTAKKKKRKKRTKNRTLEIGVIALVHVEWVSRWIFSYFRNPAVSHIFSKFISTFTENRIFLIFIIFRDSKKLFNNLKNNFLKKFQKSEISEIP